MVAAKLRRRGSSLASARRCRCARDVEGRVELPENRQVEGEDPQGPAEPQPLLPARERGNRLPPVFGALREVPDVVADERQEVVRPARGGGIGARLGLQERPPAVRRGFRVPAQIEVAHAHSKEPRARQGLSRPL